METFLTKNVSIVKNVLLLSAVMDEKWKELLEKVGDIFMRFGIKSVTMDDLARQLGVSKKTLYKYVTDKRDLVNKTFESFLEQDKCMVEEISTKTSNAIDEVFDMSEYVTSTIKDIHPSIFYDLQKYYPEAWNIFQHHKHEFVYKCIEVNLKRGIEEGLYRDNMRCDVIAKSYVMRMYDIFDSEIFPPGKYSYAELYMEIFRYHIRGVASPEGIRYLQEKMIKEQSN